ncbi:Ttll5 [Symbiodinium microadriaticum]|nr:Ttll5 [Symbiodinium microadriaticum]
MQTDDDSELPNVEDIYDLLTSDLADVEDRLRRKSSNTALTAKEEKLHNLVRVELGERRSVEEIGLALIGGRFDLANVPGLDGRSRRASPVQEGAEVWTLPDAKSPSSSSSRSTLSMKVASPLPDASLDLRQRFPPRLSMAAAQQASPSRPSQAFKPTPVNFDFVIGTSSVKKKAPKRKPKEQKELKECNDPQRKAAPKKREVSGPKATKGLPRPRGRSTNPAAQKQKDEMPAKGYPQSSQVASETAGGEEMKEGEEPDEEDLEEAEEPEELEEPRSRTSVEAPNFVSETFQEVQTRSEGQSAQIAEAQAAAEDMERGDDTENEKGKEQESTDEEAGGDAEVAEDAETAKPLVLAEVPETPEQAGSSTAMSGEHQNPDHEENEDIRSRMHLEGSHDDTGLHAEEQKDKDSPTSSHSSCPSKQSGRGLPPSFVQSKPDESPVCSETESIQPKTAMPYISRDKSRPASASSPSGTVRHELEKTYSLENEALSTTAGHAANVPGPSPRGEAPCKETSSKCEKIQKTRKPPLPHDALRAQAKSITSRANELEYVGLDPKLVETGAIRKYHEVFQNFTDIFSWGRSQEVVPQRERYLRESLQLFSQFCNIIGSLEVQFATKFGPADHSTPNATHQALNAMASRGAGLYGVFLKGIIDKMDADACTVPRPLPVETDVYSLRYYKVVQNRTEVYDIVTRVFHRKDGWEELPHGLGLSNAWNLCWTWSKPKLDYSRLCVWQKVNHFPENKHLTRKDFLKRCIDRYTRTGGKLGQYFNICPKTFVLPKEYCLFIECFTKIAEENGDLEGSSPPRGLKVPNMWIMKPAGSSRGRGIQVINDVGAVHYGELTIIQQYISDPFLLGDFKWDMRTYVTVTSFNPLEAFVYKDGFARFTTVPYNTSSDDIDNKFVHLTNSSIQRHNEDQFMQSDDNSRDMTRREEAILGGTKISFPMLRERLEAMGVDWATVWAKMVEVILKSLCMAEDFIPNQVNSFELFGYDLLMDSKMKVWLIEVNSSPSMGQEHLLDEHVKQPLISDTIDLVEPLEFDRRRLAEVLHRRVERKAATGATGGRQQLDIDLHAVLKGQLPRKYGDMPQYMGNYERIAPSEAWDSMVRTRSLLFNRVGSSN